MATVSSPPFVTDYTFMTPAEDGIPHSVPFVERPAKFWYGASLPFRIEESINILHTEIPLCNFYEAIGILHDVRSVLDEAHGMIECLDSERVKELQDRIEDLTLHVRYCFNDHLLAAKATQPDKPMTDKSVQAWFDATNEFINISKHFAIDWSYEVLWKSLHQGVIEKYQKYVNQVISNGTISKSDDALTSQRLSISPPVFQFEASGPLLTEKSSTEEVSSVFDSIVDFYKYWCRQGSSADTVAKVRVQFNTLRKTIGVLLVHPPGTKNTLKDKHINERSQLIYVGWCNHFRHKFERLVAEDLACRQSRIEATIHDEQDLEFAERQVYQLARDLQDAAFNEPECVCKQAWSDWSPHMLSPEIYSTSMLRLQQASTGLQYRMSATCEIKRIWFDLYKSLATTYLILDKVDFVFPDLDFSLETRFFLDAVHQRQFERIMREPVIANPMVVENIVAQYCVAIAYARIGSDFETIGIRQYSTNELKQTEKRVNNAYHQNLSWDPIAIRVMQKMAVRLNHLTDGPGYIRRAYLGHKHWDIDHVKLDRSPRSIFSPIVSDDDEHKLPFFAPHHQLTSEVQSDPVRVRFAINTKHSDSVSFQGLDDFRNPSLSRLGTTPPPARSRTMVETLPGRIRLTAADTSSVDTEIPSSFASWGGMFAPRDASNSASQNPSSSVSQPRSAFPEPFGINQISSFDYVNCPFPETRATEVALSRQISRELRDKTITSVGPRVEDVVNRPPRHTQTPGRISVIGRYLPYGPWDLFKALWRKSKLLRSAKLRRSIKSRYTRRPTKNKHDGLSHRKNTFRIAKPNNSQSQIPRIPKLRGGGAARRDVQGLVQVLIDRTSGFWDLYDQPSTEELIARFLQPANWDLCRAMKKVQRTYGTLSTGNTPSNRSSQGSSNAAPLNVIPSSVASQIPRNNTDPGAQPYNIYTDLTTSTTGDANAQNPTGGDFVIFQDPSSQLPRNIPLWPGVSSNVPASSSGAPAGNQDHEAQRQADRQRAQQGLPPRRRSDNSSNQENRAHPIIYDVDSIHSDDDQGQNLQASTCMAVACHRCPVYQNHYHHVCTGLIVGNSVPTSQPLSGANIAIPSIEGQGFSPQNPNFRSSSALSSAATYSPGSFDHSPNRGSNSANGSQRISEVPDSQDSSGLQSVPRHTPSGTEAAMLTNVQAATSAVVNTSSRGRGGSSGRRTLATPLVPPTRMTRARLTQINSQQVPGTSLSLAQAQGIAQAQVSTQTQAQGGGPILIGANINQAPAAPVVSPDPVTPNRGRANNRQAARVQAPPPAPPPQTGATQVRTARRAGGRGRAGFWSATSRGSPTTPNAGRADLTDPTARENPTPPPQPNPIHGQLLTARHPHDDSDNEFSGESSLSGGDSPTVGDFHTNNPFNLNRPAIPNVLRPESIVRATAATSDLSRPTDPFVLPPPPDPSRDPSTAQSTFSANIAGTSRSLASTAAAVMRALDTPASIAGNVLPPYNSDQLLASTYVTADPSARRGNSAPTRVTTAATGSSSAAVNIGSTWTAAGTRGGSEGATRGVRRIASSSFDDDLRPSRRQRRS